MAIVSNSAFRMIFSSLKRVDDSFFLKSKIANEIVCWQEHWNKLNEM